MNFTEIAKADASIEAKVEAISAVLDKKLDAISNNVSTVSQQVGPKGEKGSAGLSGKDGKDGIDGKNGRDGRDGVDGEDGKDGVSVTNVYIDFDGKLLVQLSDGREIDAGDLDIGASKDIVYNLLKQGVPWQAVIGGIATPDYVQFNTSYIGPNAVGQLKWNDTDGTLEFGMKGGNVVQQIGQEQLLLVKSSTNGGLTEGSVIYIVGSDGANITAHYAQANSELNSSTTFGVMTEAATAGQKGFCTTFGLVRGLNTSALTEGAIVWLSPTVAGGMTTTKPIAPNHNVMIGFCIRQHAVNGVIFVSVKNGYELDELHNVVITNPQNNDVLVYDSASGVWKNKQISTFYP